MAGIYIHIPFCKTRCIYCDFFSITEKAFIDSLVDAECKEVELRSHETNEPIETIYFGGGTPSFIHPQYIEKLLTVIFAHFNVVSNPEITIEVNPDDISKEKVKQYVLLGINRISVGIQSLNESLLKFLSRRHNVPQAIRAVEKIYEAGINNISIDVMYGIPGLSEGVWAQTLKTVVHLPVQHISAYHLSIEKNTPINILVKNHQIKLVSEQQSIKQYEILCKLLNDSGFQHYEISNFAKSGYTSKHNASYWNGTEYTGIGPSAHSYNKSIRRWNVSSVEKYIYQIHSNHQYFEQERLGITELFNEYLLTRLRTSAGGNLEDLRLISQEKFTMWQSKFMKEVSAGNVINDDNHFYIPEEKWLITDYILKNLFV